VPEKKGQSPPSRSLIADKGDISKQPSRFDEAKLSDPSGEEFGSLRFLKLIREKRDDTLVEIRDALFAEIKTFRKGQPQGDDMTVVLLRYIGEGRE